MEQFLKNWNLEALIPGEFNQYLKSINKEIKILQELLNRNSMDDEAKAADIINNIQDISGKLSQVNSYITCLRAQNTKDTQVATYQDSASALNSMYQIVLDDAQKEIASLVVSDFENELLMDNQFIIKEWQEKASKQLPEAERKIISKLMTDGYHSWGELYQEMVNNMQVSIGKDGKEELLSVAQATNLRSHTKAVIRKNSYFALEDAWAKKEDVFARILNHIVGFRLQVNHLKGTTALEEALFENRMKQATLEVMWKVVEKHKQPFVQYLDQKANRLGKEKLSAYDFWAPINPSNTKVKYEEAAEFIIKRFEQFGPELGQFARNAFTNGWIDAENRPNKGRFAFCAGFPKSRQSRISMTYEGTMTNVLTLAHELGHAFQNYALKDINVLKRKYPMTLAETASTFAEMIMLDGSLERGLSKDEQLFLLDEKLKRSTMNFMNLHARFMFENSFYEERKTGYVGSSRINQLMIDALSEGYKNGLEDLPVYTWASTPHFYLTNTPFYNFPYTFGYLFSICIYAKAKELGDEFEQKYMALLQDSGSMTVEDLVMKHLGEDITQEAFWEKGMQLCILDVERFLLLSK